MAKRKLVKCEVRWDTNQGLWVFRDPINGDRLAARIKAVMMQVAISWLRYYASQSLGAFSLRIYKRNGQVQEERTYPRASDPKRSKG